MFGGGSNMNKRFQNYQSSKNTADNNAFQSQESPKFKSNHDSLTVNERQHSHPLIRRIPLPLVKSPPEVTIFESVNDYENNVSSSIQPNPDLNQFTNANTTEIKTTMMNNSNDNLQEMNISNRAEEILQEARLMTSSLRIAKTSHHSGLTQRTAALNGNVTDTTVKIENPNLASPFPSTLARDQSSNKVPKSDLIIGSTDRYKSPIMLRTKSIEETLEMTKSKSMLGETPKRQHGENLTTAVEYDNIGSPKVSDGTDAHEEDFFDVTRSVASLEDLEKAVEKLPSRFRTLNKDESGQPMLRENILRRLDGMQQPNSIITTLDQNKDDKPVIIQSMELSQQPEEISWFNYFMGSYSKDADDKEEYHHKDYPVSCESPKTSFHEDTPSITTPAVEASNVDGHSKPTSYPEVVRANGVEESPLSDWVDNNFLPRDDLPSDGSYMLGESKTIIVHEILRGDWTWCTAWSPDGNQLAIATENHYLAVVDITASSVWRVRHDKKVKIPLKQASTQSIRSIAWGCNFIAIGGIGNAVSILATTDPYHVLHTITPTGFVGSISWLPGTNTLLIGSRLGKAMIIDINETDEIIQGFHFPSTQQVREIQSEIIQCIDRGKAWVNSVQFKSGENYFAIGDSHGMLSVYNFNDALNMSIENVANFKLDDSILDIQWSLDGKYLYAGGEDFAITVISTRFWEPVHKIKKDRWVQFISSSKSSSYLACGGVKSEVSILDVENGWDNIINISLKGYVPLSAVWHPDDQFLVMTGQDNSVLAIETTKARHVSGHFLRSAYPILSITFSPDGRKVAIGNKMGIVTIFTLSNKTFISAYEIVVDCFGSLSVEWSSNGAYIVIAARNKIVIVSSKSSLLTNTPPNSSGFFVAKVLRDLDHINDISIDPTSRFLAVSGTKTRVLDATTNFKNVLEMENGGTTLANAFSHDGKWFAAIGRDHSLVIYDTAHTDLSRWQSVFTVKVKRAGLALAWGPSSLGALQYCAYGGEDKHIHIMEIRTKERTWENVLSIPRDGSINDLDWTITGFVAAAISNGTVTIIDLSYLQSGCAVNEMDYDWQRQALTSFTEIRRNQGKHSMTSIKWTPISFGSSSFLAIGGTDGEVEIIDFTERDKCRGFQKMRCKTNITR